MNDLSTRVRDYLDRKKPRPQSKVTANVKVKLSKEEELQVELDRLQQSWDEFRAWFKGPFIKLMLGILLLLVLFVSLDILRSKCGVDMRGCLEVGK